MNPLGNLIFRIIEEALEQDVKQRTGVAPSAPDRPEQRVGHPLNLKEPKRHVTVKVQPKVMESSPESRMSAPDTHESRAEEAGRMELTRQDTVARSRQWILGQVILGPCKALEESGA